MASQNEHPQDAKSAGERIAKIIARSGLCSRREAELLIGDGRVSVNGSVIGSAALDIVPSDTVLVDGKPLSAREPPRLWRYYKPKGRVTTHKDPEGRPTVFEALPEGLPRLISIGRLDFNTEGLLLLTNDGDLARHLELPSTGWTRRYRVRAFGQIGEAQLQDLAGGLTVGKMNYGPIEASLEREQGDNVWVSVSIREGKNREVRRIMEHLGLTVNRLIRVSFGPFMLGDLEPGAIEEVKTAVLKDQLGPRLSRQLGVRREPMREERRLQPSRAKATYLRRKPVSKAQPERAEREDRPLKRRRIFEQEGPEAPRVEFVAERKPREARTGERRQEEPAFHGGGTASERKPRSGKVSQGRPFPARRRPADGGKPRDTEAAPIARERPERHPAGAGFGKRREAGSWRERPGASASGEKSQKTERKARHSPSRGREDAASAHRGPPKSRQEQREARPNRRFGARQEERGERQRPALRRQANGGAKPFKAAGAGAPPAGRIAGERTREQRQQGKPARSVGKPARARGKTQARETRARPEKDKETP